MTAHVRPRVVSVQPEVEFASIIISIPVLQYKSSIQRLSYVKRSETDKPTTLGTEKRCDKSYG